MRVICWNVNGFKARYAEILKLLTEMKPDILCLTETKTTAAITETANGMRGAHGYFEIWNHKDPGQRSGGVAVFSKTLPD